MPRIAPEWEVGTIHVHIMPDKQLPAVATCYGLLAVHEGVTTRMRGHWVVTHVATGWAVASVETGEDAILIAEYLMVETPATWAGKTPGAVQAAAPDWIKPWVRRCHAKGTWVDPQPFRTGE